MNKTNIYNAIQYMKTVDPKWFDMASYRDGEETTHQCKSVGCIIGHCTILDPNPLSVHGYSDDIDFSTWASEFFDLNVCTALWDFIFSSYWAEYSKSKSLKQAIRRLKYVYKHGNVPEGWNGDFEKTTLLYYLNKQVGNNFN
jgi:hypothetical protein